jgi:hypothetical protein
MISTEIYVEDYKLDLLQDISTEFTYAIDDITDFGSKNTSFSKTISLSGTAINNQIFGFVFDLGNANFFDNTLPNVNYNFNASKAAQCKIFIDKVQIFKGTLRILEIVVDNKTIEYQCSVFGELGGFITALGNSRIEDLDFSAYDHTYNVSNITSSWNSITGTGYYYPLIDFGNVSTGTYGVLKKDFQVSTFRPALFVAEYIDKMFAGTDYTYTLDLEAGDLELYNRLIVPHNQKILSSSSNVQLKAYPIDQTYSGTAVELYLQFGTFTLGNFTLTESNTKFTFTGATSKVVNIDFNVNAEWAIGQNATMSLKKNGTAIASYNMGTGFSGNFFQVNFNLTGVTINTNDYFQVHITWSLGSQPYEFNSLSSSGFNMTTTSVEIVPINYGENIKINNVIPKGIFQRDFFLSICKMFNLYVYDDKWNDKKIIIKPYINFYPSVSDNAEDWSNKIDRSKPLSIKPMSELNARYYQYKYKTDNDFYNENYSKKYSQGYADRIYDTEFDFSKNTETTEIIFAPSVLFQQTGTDKIYAAIYKKSNNNTTEDTMDSVIRIMQVKKITGVTSWNIMNLGTVLSSPTAYGYAGHLDDPTTPANDINFGVPKELSFTPTTYPTTNLFNAYHSDYIAEITDKNSKLLTCSALLNTIDILNLDFSKYIWIDGVLFRLNKVDGFNPMEYNTTKISLLKVIETTY